MTKTNNANLAALLLRVSMGILFLAHAGLKTFIFTPAGTAGSSKASAFPVRSPMWLSRRSFPVALR